MLLFWSVALAQEAIPGDANDSGTLEAADVDVLLDELLERGLAPVLADCNGDGETSLADAVCLVHVLEGRTELSIDPAVAFVTPTLIQEFEAFALPPAPPDVTWSAEAGSILGIGARVLYQPPEGPGEYLITARSLADPTATIQARVVVSLDPVLQFVSDQTIGLTEVGGQHRFEVEVLGDDGLPLPDGTVTWESAGPSRVSVLADGDRAAAVTVMDDSVARRSRWRAGRTWRSRRR